MHQLHKAWRDFGDSLRLLIQFADHGKEQRQGQLTFAPELYEAALLGSYISIIT